ncbi:MAG: DNA polymerase III subunit alpha [Candidatus Sericytochromatia bacterium]|nr:DNA polymerase III subunit alpha [Candidatus Sericytochromatia bacterium]
MSESTAEPAATASFVHCNVHSQYSLLDATNRIDELVSRAKELNMPALALTDNGVMYGILDFYKRCRSNGIKPLLGCKMYVTPKGIQHRSGRRSGEDIQRLTLIAKNNKGFENLLKLVSISHIEGFYYKPRVDHPLLEKYSEGLIAMSGGMGGEIARKLMSGDYAGAKQIALWYRERFDYYLELQDHHIQMQAKINQDLLRIGKELDIPVVATNDVHYLKREDAILHEITLCINDGKTLDDPSRYRYPGGPEYYFKSPEEMQELFKEIPEALSNTLEIAEKCHVIIETGVYKLPMYDVPVGHDEVSYLRERTWKGIKWRYDEITEVIRERTEFELGVIERMGFCSYFLIVWDFMNYARENGIAVGPGRGSAAGSIVSYALGITDVDPLPYDLLFERFLNPDRISMPDIDIDFCIERREEVIQYVTRKYGSDKVAQILTVGTLAAKAVVRDIARTLGFPPSEADRLAKMLPTKPGTKLKDHIGEGTDLGTEMAKNKDVKQLIEYALKLEGNARQVGVHAAGVVISRDPLDTVVPLRAEDGKLITQFTKDEVEEVGLLKMDFLGLRNLTMIAKTLEIVKKSHGLDIDMSRLPMDDAKAFQLLSSGETIGVFQLESAGMQKLVRRLMPNCIEDVTALVALYRPGPLGSGMDVDFVERKFGRQEVSYYHPKLESLLKPILKDTYGLILYQEQIMLISREVSGFTPGEADTLRKAMGKKQLDVMAKMKAKFVEGARAHDIPDEASANLFGIMEEFAKYGFNKSHSAAYAYVAYHTAYLKANYPVAYMAALISSVMSTQDKVPLYVSEARRMGIEILPPDINESLDSFSVSAQQIRFGLGAVKNLGEGAIENILAERKQNGPFSSLFDFCSRVDLRLANKRAVESLIKAGAFGQLHGNRRQLLHHLDEMMSAATQDQKQRSNGQMSLFDTVEAEELDFQREPAMTPMDEFGLEELLNAEKEVIGLYVSGHPLDEDITLVEAFARHRIIELSELEPGRETTVAGLVLERREVVTKKGDPMMIVKLEDLSGQIEVVAFPKTFQQYAELLRSHDRLLVTGKMGDKRDENDSSSLVLNSAMPLRDLPTLTLHFEAFDKKLMTSLRFALQEHPGKTPVMLCAEAHPEHLIALGMDFWVEPDEKLLTRLRQRLGDDRVVLRLPPQHDAAAVETIPELQTV